MDQNERDKALQMQKRLDEVSPTFCTVKWKHATLNLGSGAVKSCCHLPFRKVEQVPRKAGFQLHETAEDRRERAEMLKGQKPKDCNYCWWIESQGHLSDRITWSSKSWMAPFLTDVAEANSDLAQGPSWLELNFSNTCNLKCSYCSPIFSSKWLQEIKEYGPYPTDPGHNDINYLPGIEFNEKFDNTQLMNEFWPWFEGCYKDLRLLKITGGEPFLSPHTLKVLQWVLDHPNPKLNLSINSNLSVPDNIWNQAMDLIVEIEKSKAIEKFYLHPSIDTFGPRAEYIRHGLDLQIFQRHVDEYLKKTTGHLVFICTLNNLSLAGLLDFWKYMFSLKQEYGQQGRWISVTSEVLLGPDWQNINILPDTFQGYLVECIQYAKERLGNGMTHFSTFELSGLERALDMMKKPNEKLNLARKNFYRFFSEHDRRRNTDFNRTFPELKEFWQICAGLAGVQQQEVLP